MRLNPRFAFLLGLAFVMSGYVAPAYGQRVIPQGAPRSTDASSEMSAVFLQTPAPVATIDRPQPAPVVVRLVNGSDAPVPGIRLRLVSNTSPNGNGSWTSSDLRNASAVTDSTGTATFHDFTVLGLPRTLKLAIQTPGGSVFDVHTLIASARVDSISMNSSLPNSYEIGLGARRPPSVIVYSGGAPVAGATVQLSVVNGGGIVSGADTISNAEGIASFPQFSLSVRCPQRQCPTQTLRFTSGGARSADFQIAPLPPHPAQFKLLDSSSITTRVGQRMSSARARILSADGVTPVTDYSVTVHFPDGKDDTVKSDDEGGVQIPLGRIIGPAGTYAVTADAGSQHLEIKINASTGAAEKMMVVQQPPITVMVDTAFRAHPIVRVVDAGGNPVKGVEVRAELCALPDEEKGNDKSGDKKPDENQGKECINRKQLAALNGPASALSNEHGDARFDSLAMTGRKGNYQLRFIVDGLRDTAKSSILVYKPDYVFDHSYVTISAIKSIAGVTPSSEFFDLRFRFRIAPDFSVVAATDLALSARGTDSVKSQQRSVTEGGVWANVEPFRWRDPANDIPERAITFGAQMKVFNTVPYYGVHIGEMELGGSAFHGSTVSFGYVAAAYRNQVVVEGDTINPANRNLIADFYVRSSKIEFFKVLTIRGSILMPLIKSGALSSRIAIAIPVGTLERF